MSSAIASFRLRELFPIGRGGMGTTYLACASTGTFERLVVVKRLNDHLVEESDARLRLIEEARLAGYVHHANVVGIHHAGLDDRGTFLVLDYVEGASLREVLRTLAPEKIPEPIALRIMLDCLAGLHAIHTARDTRGQPLAILHRDVTPENVLIGLDGVARLGDFGIAKSRQSEVHTSPLQLVGKLPFLAPEYIDRGDVGPELDVYAAGVSLWRLLAGHAPWPRLEEAQLLVRILTEGVPPLPEAAGVSEELRRVVARACARRASERYPSAQSFAKALEALQASHPIAEPSQVAELLTRTYGSRARLLRERAAEVLGVPSLPPPAPSSAPPAAAASAEISGATPERDVEPSAMESGSRYLDTTHPARRPGAPRARRLLMAAAVLTALATWVAAGAIFRNSTQALPSSRTEGLARVETPHAEPPRVETPHAEPPRTERPTRTTESVAEEPAPRVVSAPAPPTTKSVARSPGSSPPHRDAPSGEPLSPQPITAPTSSPSAPVGLPAGGVSSPREPAPQAKDPHTEGIVTRNPYPTR